MSVFLLISALLLSASHSTADFLTLPTRQYAEGEEARELVSMKRCRNEASPLVRLDCYDNALNIQGGETHRQDNAGPAWHRAMEQEKTRPGHATTFLVNAGTGDNPSVIITTPAIGVPPPRPVLMLSCIDNITRLQIASVNRVKDGNIILNIDQMRLLSFTLPDHVAFILLRMENGMLLPQGMHLDTLHIDVDHLEVTVCWRCLIASSAPVRVIEARYETEPARLPEKIYPMISPKTSPAVKAI